MRSAAWRRGGGALRGRGRSVSPAAGSRSPAGRGQHRGGRSPAGRGSIGAGDHRQGAAAAGSRSHRQGAAAAGGRSPAGRGQHRGERSPAAGGQHRGSRSTARAWQHRGGAIPWQGVAAAGGRSPAGRGSSCGRSPAGRGQQLAADHRQQGGQGLKAAKSSHAKDESPTGILSTHMRVAAEKIFFTPRRGVIWGEKRPFPARGRKPCYDFCVGRESPPAKQKLHSADHGAERISP